jgi:hypothetical protein
MSRTYPAESWLDPRLEVRESPIHGKALVATGPIMEGEVVVIWGGTLFSEEEMRAGNAHGGSVAAIDEGLYLGSPAGAAKNPDDYMNHSCDPNVWMADEVTLVARRDIAADEELTADYAMWEATEEYVMPWNCRCGSPLCRKTITGKDWRLRELQQRYRGHFAPFLNRRIERLSARG